MNVRDSDPQTQDRTSTPVQTLWARAPGFRWISYLAAGISIAAVLAFALNRPSAVPEATRSAEPVNRAQNVLGQSQPLRHTGATAQSSAQGTPPLPQPMLEPASQALAEAPSEEESILARCHPHLLPSSTPVPQIDVSGIQDPTVGHLKVHFWVSGGGLVTREAVTGSSFSTVQEQQAELAFTKALTFAVPQTAECRVREIELIGDYYETKGSAGKWATVAKLYPRLSFGPDGALVTRE